eukprot:Nitzschia sp. Nitz4//scaffold138_size62050//15640//17850//NITZ4_006384-RA/size62050-augustus-gene-0.28-mRNA-1//-1//CDS//3329535755//5168//frame0
MPPSVAKKDPPHQHGVKGVYYGGHWLDLEDACPGTFTGVEEKCSGCTRKDADKKCPRSRSATTAGNGVDYDVCIIGAGCIGAAVARELSKYATEDLSILWLEAADDVSQGATKGNSGIVHAGYDDKPGTNRAKFCWRGNQMFPQLDRELRFGYQLNGSLVVATKEEDRKELQNLLERGKINGVERLRIVEREELMEMEPYLKDNVVAALYSPDAGNVIPYEYAIALAENAVDNGVELRIRREVTSIDCKSNEKVVEIKVKHWEPRKYGERVLAEKEGGGKNQSNLKSLVSTFCGGGAVALLIAVGAGTIKATESVTMAIATCLLGLPPLMFLLGGGSKGPYDVPTRTTPLVDLVKKAGQVIGIGGAKVDVEDMKVGGSGSSKIVDGITVEEETVRAKFVINCAGGASDRVAKMIGDDSFNIKPRLGDYLLLRRNQGHLAKHTLFPCPDPVLGKGVLVQTTLWGNLILGPTARDMHKDDSKNMSTKSIQHYILSKCRDLVPGFDASETIHGFCGARAKSDRGDWIIENSAVDARMIHVAGIDSPGLAGSPAIALEVVQLLEETGCQLTKNPKFNPQRAPIITPKGGGMRGLKLGPVGKNDSDGLDENQMAANVICKCEKVTELEVVRALRRSLPVDSTQGIRKRTRAGMGHCQGDPDNYGCESRVKAIIAREMGIPIEEVGGRPWPATSTLSQRWPDSDEKSMLQQLADDRN